MKADVTQSRTCHPVYRSMNKPLTIWGAERRLFFLALVIGGATFSFFGGLGSGLLMFLLLYFGARWATETDRQLLRILLNSAAHRVRYDPAKLGRRDEDRAW
jgi:type IV secretory pathway TrbD component